MYPQAEIDPKLIARIDDVYLRNLDMPELIEKARIAVIGHAAKLLKQDPGRTIDYIVLDMPCTFFMLRSLRYAGLHFVLRSTIVFCPLPGNGMVMVVSTAMHMLLYSRCTTLLLGLTSMPPSRFLLLCLRVKHLSCICHEPHWAHQIAWAAVSFA